MTVIDRKGWLRGIPSPRITLSPALLSNKGLQNGASPSYRLKAAFNKSIGYAA